MSPSDKRAAIVRAAHDWVDTPYHHQARVKGVGVDCAQLIAGIAEDVGLVSDSKIPANYSPEWHLHNREEMLMDMLRYFGCVEVPAAQMGDILCFRFGRAVGHLGVLIDQSTIIHARIDLGKVVLNTLTDDLKRRHTHTFTFPGTS
jgi:NlpC/P60 family putative phage cell wall peptidase